MGDPEKEAAIGVYRKVLVESGNLAPEEIDELINFQFITGPESLRDQLRRYYLLIRSEFPNHSEQFLEETSGIDVMNPSEVELLRLSNSIGIHIRGSVITHRGIIYSDGEIIE